MFSEAWGHVCYGLLHLRWNKSPAGCRGSFIFVIFGALDGTSEARVDQAICRIECSGLGYLKKSNFIGGVPGGVNFGHDRTYTPETLEAFTLFPAPSHHMAVRPGEAGFEFLVGRHGDVDKAPLPISKRPPSDRYVQQTCSSLVIRTPHDPDFLFLAGVNAAWCRVMLTNSPGMWRRNWATAFHEA